MYAVKRLFCVRGTHRFFSLGRADEIFREFPQATTGTSPITFDDRFQNRLQRLLDIRQPFSQS